MKKLNILVAIWTFAIVFSSLGHVLAEENPISSSLGESQKILISELQNNGDVSGTSSYEFIELYNNGIDVVNLMGYKLVYVNSTGTMTDLYTFSEPYLFLPDTFIIGKLKFSSEIYLKDVQADFVYDKGESGLAATAGGIKLVDEKGVLIDELYWTSANTSPSPAITGLSGGKSAQRYFLDDVLISDNSNLFINEFIVDKPNPKEFLYKVTPPPIEPPTSPPNDNEDEQSTTNNIVNPPIYINELFIDPESPLLDSQDEFIELYNPNTQNIDISGYELISGLSTKYSYKIPNGTVIPASSYLTFYSKDTSLTLSNSGSNVTLKDNLGNFISESTYQDAKAGESWAFIQQSWQWTTKITANEQNILAIKPDIIKPIQTTKTNSAKSSSKSTKTNLTSAPPIIINEVFPDPISPQKDSMDEFIELYNPHDFSINIADYIVTAGLDKKYKHTIKAPAVIEAKGYFALSSADTTLSLNNSGGSVTLTNNFDKVIATVEYPKAVPGASWSYLDGKWQWVSVATKNSPNVASGLVDSLLNTKQNESNTKVASAKVAGTDNTPLVSAPQPLPGWALAVLGLTAICYAGYEYRFEARNYYFKFRRIRSLR